MGTEITLDVGGMSVTYSKNYQGLDHGSIFQEQDRKAIKSVQLDYDWYAEVDCLVQMMLTGKDIEDDSSGRLNLSGSIRIQSSSTPGRVNPGV